MNVTTRNEMELLRTAEAAFKLLLAKAYLDGPDTDVSVETMVRRHLDRPMEAALIDYLTLIRLVQEWKSDGVPLWLATFCASDIRIAFNATRLGDLIESTPGQATSRTAEVAR